MSMNSISIVIPLYNEERNIKILFEDLINSLHKNFIFQLIFVDDGSTDESKKILESIMALKKCDMKVVYLKKNRGQSYAIKIGIETAKYEDIVTIDSDLQNKPSDIIKLANFYFKNNEQYSLVGGIRKKRRDSMVKIFSSKIANKIRKFFLNDNCDDTGCSLKIFKKSIFLSFVYFNGIHRFLPAMFKGYGYKTFFLDVDHRHRIYGVSKYGVSNRLFRGIRDLIKVKIILMKNKYTNNKNY